MLIVWHHPCQWRLQWFVPVCIYIFWQNHLPLNQVLHFSGCERLLWLFRSLIPLWKLFASTSSLYHVGICLCRSEDFHKVLKLASFLSNGNCFSLSAVRSSGLRFTAVKGLALRVCWETRLCTELYIDVSSVVHDGN